MNETLEKRFDKAEEKIKQLSNRQNKGLSNEVGYYIFDYDPERELYVRERVESIKQNINRNDNEYKAAVFDLYDILIEISKAKGFWEKNYEFEKKKGIERVTRAIGNMLRITTPDNLIVQYIKDHTDDINIVFIVGIGKVYPLLRSYNILNNLRQAADNIPVVMFYPGKYDGQELILFSKIKDDNYYRAFKLVD